MLYDRDIREPLFDFLEEKYGKCRMLEEKIMGSSRADIVMVTEDSFYGIEIKSDRDSYARLSGQVRDYERFFDRNYVVVGSSHAGHIAEHVPAHWGIISVEEAVNAAEGAVLPSRKTPDFYLLREPADNPNVEPQRKLSLLWRPELRRIQERNGMPEYKRLVKKRLLEKIAGYVDYPILRREMSAELFERDYTKIGEEIERYRLETLSREPGKRGGVLPRKSKSGKRRRREPELLVSRVVRGRRGK